MDRRDFVSAAMAGGAWLAAGAVTNAVQQRPVRAAEYYELRRYHLRRGPGQGIVDGYLKSAALPAAARAGAGRRVQRDDRREGSTSLHACPGCLAADAEYQSAAAPYLNVEATSPAYVRIDTSLMRAFEGLPKLELPFAGGDGARRPRIFELRTYESHSEKAARKKIDMFNGGEIAIFRRAGMTPVFFGETLAGAGLPNLTYMLAYEDMAAHDKQWSAFAADPEWKKLSATPGFTDPEIVSSISNMYLRPTAYSQI
jgi:hypothetical protein